MTDLRLETLTMPAASLGPENPLPPLHALRTTSVVTLPPPEAGDYPDRGNEAAVLPWRLQDGYDRVKRPRAFRAAVLENEFLRATFLPELGGRLWSLHDKRAGRELLHVNPVFQPANLAVRDAWFSGGVEWNLSIIGHCPFTCSPLFAGRGESADGSPFLRFWEFERIRGVTFQIDVFLPPRSPFLFVRPRIVNANDRAVPMYWWSNAAVDEADGLRVWGPADGAWYHDYDGTLKSQSLPLSDGRDLTYPARRPAAADLYFRIPEGRRPWVTALDASGRGLVQTSTDRLKGRKMFVWGTDPGGRRWQEHLAAPGHRYVEIQAGLAPTQTEYVVMPAGATWGWLEAYGPLQADPAAVHGDDWPSALSHVEQRLEAALPRAAVEQRLRRWAPDADHGSVEIFQTGSGWGALERRRRQKLAAHPPPAPGTRFPDSTLGTDQEPWLRLLEEGALPPPADPSQPPGSFMTQPEWHAMLEQSVASGRGVHWLSLLHLGVMRYRAGDRPGARDAWQRSAAVAPTAWAARNLAVLLVDEGDAASSADLWLAAARLKPGLTPLAVEACEALLKAGRHAAVREFITSLPADVAGAGRVRFLGAAAALRCGDLAPVERLFAGGCEIANIREGELSLSDLWFEWHEARLSRAEGVPVDEALRGRVRREWPVPREYDFRMHPGQ